MKLLDRYLIREFVKPLMFTTVIFGGLVLISEFFRELSFYLEHKTSFLVVFTYLFLNFPWWVIQVLPVSVLLAVLFSLGQLSRHNEMTAVKAAGIDLWRVIAVFAVCGMAIGIIDTGLREAVVPAAVHRAEKIRQQKIKREPPVTQAEYTNIVVSIPRNGRMTIGYLNLKKKNVKQVVIDYYDDDFNLVRQLVAEDAVWKNRGWMLGSGVERTFKQEQWTERYFKRQYLPLHIPPSKFVVNRLRPEQMTIKEHRNYLKQFKTLGIPYEKELIQYHLRFSSVFSHLIVMTIGIPFALGLGSKHGKMVSFSFALIFSFIYWGVQAVGQSLGENKILTPFLAAWLGNIMFGIIGAVLLSKVKK